MRVALAADHAGVTLKTEIARLLETRGLEYRDFGTNTADSVDYPDYAEAVGRGVASGEFDRGILICGTGIGMAMAANKIDGVRAAPVVSSDTAQLAREHNDANVIALGARFTSQDVALHIVETFLDTAFLGGRHARRVEKVAALEGHATGASRS